MTTCTVEDPICNDYHIVVLDNVTHISWHNGWIFKYIKFHFANGKSLKILVDNPYEYYLNFSEKLNETMKGIQK